MTNDSSVLIKELRVELDSYDQILFKYLQKTPQIKAASSSLLMAKAWLGKLLGILGEATPYKKDGKRHSIKDIEPAADKSVSNFAHVEKMNEIERLDWLREKIKTVEEDFESMCQNQSSVVLKIDVCLLSVSQHLTEARFWLGLDLGRIRDSEKARVS